MEPKVRVHLGEVLGVKEDFQNGATGYSFRGIPYAADTSGKNRWRVPQEPQPWTEVFDASSFGPQCPQFRSGESGFRSAIADAYGVDLPKAEKPIESEDCLRLNVYSPDLKPKEAMPVMVWIHGGGFRYGSGDIYLPDTFIKNGTILVTINYRLGELGFFAHPALNKSEEEIKTNFGLLDQIKSLEWVKRNIEQFGGDPTNVTIFGESAGGFSVAALLVSPLSKGLFHKAIIQSGGFARMALHAEEISAAGLSGADVGLSFCKRFGIEEGPEQLNLMRDVSIDDLIQKGIGAASSFYTDGVSMLSPVMQGFEDGINHKVPTIIGTNADEGTALYWGSPLANIPPPVNTVEKYLKVIGEVFKEDKDNILKFYPASNEEEMLKSSKSLLGDSLFGAPSYFASKAMADRKEEIYFYHFNQKPSGNAGEIIGAFHASEISYVFGITALNPIEDNELSRIMNSYWINFSRFGDPNGSDLPNWKIMKPNQDAWHLLGSKVGEEYISRLDIYSLLKRIS